MDVDVDSRTNFLNEDVVKMVSLGSWRGGRRACQAVCCSPIITCKMLPWLCSSSTLRPMRSLLLRALRGHEVERPVERQARIYGLWRKDIIVTRSLLDDLEDMIGVQQNCILSGYHAAYIGGKSSPACVAVEHRECQNCNSGQARRYGMLNILGLSPERPLKSETVEIFIALHLLRIRPISISPLVILNVCHSYSHCASQGGDRSALRKTFPTEQASRIRVENN